MTDEIIRATDAAKLLKFYPSTQKWRLDAIGMQLIPAETRIYKGREFNYYKKSDVIAVRAKLDETKQKRRGNRYQNSDTGELGWSFVTRKHQRAVGIYGRYGDPYWLKEMQAREKQILELFGEKGEKYLKRSKKKDENT